jgi:hypothetical protein
MKGKTAANLFRTIQRAIKRLSILAQADGGSGEAASFLGSLPRVAMNRSLDVLALMPASEPSVLSDVLSRATIDANFMFHYAVKARPSQFTRFARKSFLWPSLRYARHLSNRNDESKRVADAIGLGADLANEWGVKAEGTISLESPAVRITLECVKHVEALRQEPDSYFMDVLLPKQSAEASLPVLTRDPEVLRIWWEKAIKPLLEPDREHLLKSVVLRNYRKRALKAVTGKNSCRAKPDTKAWNFFIRDCQAALRNLAPRVTEKSSKKP